MISFSSSHQKVILSIFKNHPYVFPLYHFHWMNRIHYKAAPLRERHDGGLFSLRTCTHLAFIFFTLSPLSWRGKEENIYIESCIMYFQFIIYQFRTNINNYIIHHKRWWFILRMLWHIKREQRNVFIKNSIALYYSWDIFKRCEGKENIMNILKKFRVNSCAIKCSFVRQT